MRVISLFSGIGGLDLGFERAGVEIVAQVETDDFCRKVLRRHWPNVALYEDVRHVGRHNLPCADVIMGGFPCQDVSLAGKRQGIKEGTRSGLWLEFARIIGELRPRIVLLENVPAITTLDGTCVITDLAALGYDAEWGIVAASDVGAPHRRERWFCVAYPGLSGRDTGKRMGSSATPMGEMADGGSAFSNANVAYPIGSGTGLEKSNPDRQRRKHAVTQQSEMVRQSDRPIIAKGSCSNSTPLGDARCARLAQRAGVGGDDGEECAPAERTGRDVAVGTHGAIEPRMGRVFDGLPGWLDGIRRDSRWPARPGEAQAEWEAPRTVTGKVKDRASRIKALGNAVVPQVAYAMALVVKQKLADQGK